RRVNQQVLRMSDRSAPNLLGCIEDKGAYAPPEAVHRANSEAAVGPSSSRHDDLSSVRTERRVGSPTIHADRDAGNSYSWLLANRPCLRIRHQPFCKLRVPGLAKTSIERKNLGVWCCGTHATPLQALFVFDQHNLL